MSKSLFLSLIIALFVSAVPSSVFAGLQEDYDDINRFLQWGDMEQFSAAVKKNKAAANFNNGAIIIDYANFMSDPAFLKILLDAGANPNAKQPTTDNNALHILLGSCSEDNVATVVTAIKMLIAKGIDVNHRNAAEGYTPLHVAARNEYVPLEVFQALMSAKNIDCNIKCNMVNEFMDGAWPPLFHLVQRVNDLKGDEKDIVKLFIERKADMKMKTAPNAAYEENNFTLLHLCAKTAGDHADVMEVLLTTGIDIEAFGGTDHHSPLHVAMLFNNPKISQLLLEKGADYMSPNKDNVSILEHSKAWGRSKNLESAEVIISWAEAHPKK